MGKARGVPAPAVRPGLMIAVMLAGISCQSSDHEPRVTSAPTTRATGGDGALLASGTTTMPPHQVEANVGVPDFLDADHGFAAVGVVCETSPCRFDIVATVDGGLTWERRSRQPLAISTSSLLGVPQPIVHFATTAVGWLFAIRDRPDEHGGRLWRTTDGGRTWTETATGEQTVALVSHQERVWRVERYCPMDAGTKQTPCRVTVFTSSDTGAHWSSLEAQPQVTGVLEDFAASSSSVAYVLSNSDTAYDPDDPTLGTLARTTDGGRSWQKMQAPCAGSHGEDLATSTPFDLWYVCHDQPGSGAMAPKHLYRSTEGGTHWSGDLGAPNLGAGGQTAAGSAARACRGGARTHISCTRNGGHDWFFPPSEGEENPRDGGVTIIEFADPQHAWALGQDGETGSFNVLWRTTDGGESWSSSRITP